jgi:hypothetical protein
MLQVVTPERDAINLGMVMINIHKSKNFDNRPDFK